MKPFRIAPPVLAAALCAGGAWAQSSQTNSPYVLGVSQTFGHESNLLRLADGQATPAGYSRSDTVSSTALLLGFDQPIGRQRVFANASLRNNRYSENSLFNNRGYSASAGLEWSTVERISGSLIANGNRSLQRNYDEIGFLGEKNLETSTIVAGNVSVGVVTQYSLELSGSRREVRNSLENQLVQAREFDQDTASVGVRWRPSGISSLSLSVGNSQGRYPKFRIAPNGAYEADRFKRSDVTLSGSFRPSGASSIDARISSGKTEYDLNQQRDFSGVTGSIAWNWQPTGKLRASVNLTRDTGQDSYSVLAAGTQTTADYSRIGNVLRLQAQHALSAKINLTAALAYHDRKLVRTLGNPVLAPEASGRDRTTAGNLGARWTPLRSVMVGCDLGSERRRGSGQLVADLSGTSFSCFGQVSLQ